MDPKINDFSLDYYSLKGKVAIVTGGNTNLGMAYAVAFAKAGADLFIPHFTDDIDELKAAVEKEGRRIEFFKGDLTDKAYRHALVQKCIELYGKIDILVNNAGISFKGSFDEYKDEWYQRELELNLNVGYYLCREIGSIMRKQGHGGKIINIGSALSLTGSRGDMTYAISKHAVIGLTRCMASEFIDDNIQCNAVCPGFFKSPVNAGMSQEGYDNVARRLPNKEWGSFSDMMGTMVFLASRASDYVNGTYIVVDGGFAAHYI